MFLTIYVGMLCPHKVHCNSLFILSVFQLFTVVRNVKEAHECQEYGEKQEFQDDVDYILDGLQSSQPLPTRCLRYNAYTSINHRQLIPIFLRHTLHFQCFVKMLNSTLINFDCIVWRLLISSLFFHASHAFDSFC